MGCVTKVVPWIIDPAGMAISTASGGKIPTIGGVVDRQLNPPPKPAPHVAPAASPGPQMPVLSGPKITGPSVPAANAAAPPPGDKAGAQPGTDATKGLLKKPGAGRTLLT